MNTLGSVLLAAAMAQTGLAANLAISTYLKSGFTPAAIASDSQGNIYLAGSAVIDPASQSMGAMVAKLDPNATQFLYLAYLDSAADDQVSGLAVDGSGNAYITGWTANPNFPVVGGGALGTAPAGGSDTRSFVTKLNAQGAVVFSALIGGSAVSTARALALTPQGQILVSGLAGSQGFPSTAGAYTVADTTNQWFLTELDATASKTIFSATGIGGSAMAQDAAGNIYVAGSNPGTTYPTTAGAYQTTFTQGFYCFGLCQISFPGNLQHVTKTDPAASKLIYSTGLNDTTGRAGSTTNTGLAVDAAGNAYVTGTLLQAAYPFTVTAPDNPTGYLSKLDAAGANLLFSVPVGGGGVQLDAAGSVYVGGTISDVNSFLELTPTPAMPFVPAVFSWVPQPCVPNNNAAVAAAYLIKLDAATGNQQDGQWIDGSAPGATGITLAGGKVWITGPTPAPDVPFTPGVLAPTGLGPGFLEGAYVAAADFRGGVNTGPAIACVLDSGNLTHVGALASFRLISVFGANLGPATPAAAPPGGLPSLGGVSVTFDGNPAQLLYASASQINVVTPPSPGTAPLQGQTVMQLATDGANLQRQFPLTLTALNLFADLSVNQLSCGNTPTASGFQPVATNPDGSLNSCTNPARYGSTISLYAHGVGYFGPTPPQQLLNLQATVGNCSAAVTSTTLVDEFVYKVNVSLPASALPCWESFPGVGYFPVTLSYNDMPVGPLAVPADLAGPVLSFTPPGQPLQMIVWVAP